MAKKEAPLMQIFVMAIMFAFLCFIGVYILKNSESKYRLDKTKAVEGFIKNNQIQISEWYSGKFCDLIDDEENEMIWFFVLERKQLKYKQIPYDELFYVGLTYDNQTVDSYRRTGQMKKEMLGGEGFGSLRLGIPGNISDFNVVKNMSLTIVVDDRHAAVIEALFLSHSFFANIKTVKDAEINHWFRKLGMIIQAKENELRKSEP